MTPSPSHDTPQTVEQVLQPVTRRTFLKGGPAAMVGLAVLVAALKPLLALERGELTLDDLLQKHYRELTPDQLRQTLQRLAETCRTEYGVTPNPYFLQ